ncbi:thioesterase [Streptomyces sp. So13.3]|uniref:thioesterase II family protein n=1 Tax=Streptomyces TaxID=1883 RepID=UPI00110735DF|nr:MULTISPECIES: thioesterase domain-containing protein [unclassified Streptomyces]MCZ4101603.1 thioesterase domain-containing protein [Streptomyces sp. H39-C1]QNA76354.1 thioesterase [Streptomyces sp. So13.3]
MTAATVRLLPPAQAQDASVHPVPDLYCFPHAGGGVPTFLPWNTALAGQVRVHAVGYPDPAPGGARSITAVASAIADRLRPGPGAIFLGHSMGSLVAFETVRELHRRGVRGPQVLVVAAHAAPHLARQRPPVHTLASGSFWQEVGALGGTPPEVLRSPELRLATEPRLRADFAACETYRFTSGPPLSCRVLAYAGADDPQAGPAAMQAWQLHTLGGFSLATRPGDHFFLHDDPIGLVQDVLAHAETPPWDRR